jgi:hypothetical protein
MTITANGQTVPINGTPPWAPGGVYVVTVSGTAGASYGLTLNIGQ